MKSVPITDEDPVLPLGIKQTFGPPRGVSEEDCYTCEAVVLPGDKLGPETWLRIELEDEDLDRVTEHRAFYLIISGGGLPPFAFATIPTTAEQLAAERDAAVRVLELCLSSGSKTIEEMAERLAAELDNDMLAVLNHVYQRQAGDAS